MDEKKRKEILEEMKSRYVTSNKPKVITIMLETIDLTEKAASEEIFKAIRKHLIDSGFGDLIDENFIEMEKKFGIKEVKP